MNNATFSKKIQRNYPILWSHLLSIDCVSPSTNTLYMFRLFLILGLNYNPHIETEIALDNAYEYIQDNEDLILFRLL